MIREEFDTKREEIAQKYPKGMIVHKLALAYEYIDSLEQRNTELEKRVKELEDKEQRWKILDLNLEH